MKLGCVDLRCSPSPIIVIVVLTVVVVPKRVLMTPKEAGLEGSLGSSTSSSLQWPGNIGFSPSRLCNWHGGASSCANAQIYRWRIADSV